MRIVSYDYLFIYPSIFSNVFCDVKVFFMFNYCGWRRCSHFLFVKLVSVYVEIIYIYLLVGFYVPWNGEMERVINLFYCITRRNNIFT